MGKFIYLGIFLAGLDPTYQEASDQARRALWETDMMKHEMVQLQDDAERRLYDYTGLTKEDLAYAGYAYPIFAGKVSTKPFKNFKYETEQKWIIRPELEYGLYNKESSAFLVITKEW